VILLRTFIILLIFNVIALGCYNFLLPCINGTINPSFGSAPANSTGLIYPSNSSAASAAPANSTGLIYPSNSSAASAAPANSTGSLNQSNSSAASAAPANSKNFNIKVGQGNSSVSYNQYYPSYIEITQGDSITWHNGIKVPLPHTVTFIQGLNHIEKISLPFYLSHGTTFTPVMDNLGEPWVETTSGAQIVMLLNYRALNPTAITVDEKVLNLGTDSKYVFQGNETFVNSGPLLALNKKQNFDYPFSNFFTLVFNKPGLYEYSCLFHPWMVGKVLVKPK
jgi:plastocyanin